MTNIRKKRKVDARKQRDPSQRPVVPCVSARSVSDEHPIPQQSRIIRQDGEEVATQSSTAIPVTAAVQSCSVCGKRMSTAVTLRCVLQWKLFISK
jgi:hypothetical protein